MFAKGMPGQIALEWRHIDVNGCIFRLIECRQSLTPGCILVGKLTSGERERESRDKKFRKREAYMQYVTSLRKF